MPHSARAGLVSSRMLMASPAGVFSTAIRSGQVKESSPLAPFTVIFWPLSVAVTPAGMGTGLLPMRDISFSLQLVSFRRARLENVTQDFAAHVLLAGTRVRHHSLWRRQNGDP